MLPLLAVAIPPLHDYPFHLARAEAIAALFDQVNHATIYRLGSILLPNEAMDAVMLALTAVMTPLLAGRVFLGLVQGLLLGGTVALHYALHRRVSPWPLLAGFFLYNWIFTYGFTNYLFGVAVMLWAVAGWVALAGAGWALRLALGTVAAVVLLFCHLMAFGLFAVVLGGLALHDAMAARRGGARDMAMRLLLPAVPVAVALLVFVALSPAATEARQPLAYHGWWGWKPLMAWRPLLGTWPALDLVTLGPVALVVAVLLARRRLALAPAMPVPLVLLVMAFAVMPYELFGSLYGDARLPVAVLLVAIASVDLRRVAPRAVLAGSLLLALVLAGRCAAIAQDWRRMEPVLARHMAAFAALPPGAVLWSATAAPYPRLAYRNDGELALWRPPLKHVASLAGVGRDVFVVATWVDPNKQPINLPAEHAAAKRLQGNNPFETATAADLAAAVAAIRQLGSTAPAFLLLSYPGRMAGALPAGLSPVAEGPDFLLLRID
ncbi:MAG: hypothetical protein IT555_08315 [Acetobacteraceae bacterium]|nr:hypothetical protein [Acetobacteraceae bacterium]